MSLAERLQRVIRQDVQSMHGYAIQPSAGFVKLDAMENPSACRPSCSASWASASAAWRSTATRRSAWPTDRRAGGPT